MSETKVGHGNAKRTQVASHTPIPSIAHVRAANARRIAASLPAMRITVAHMRAHIARIALGTSPAAIAARNALTR